LGLIPGLFARLLTGLFAGLILSLILGLIPGLFAGLILVGCENESTRGQDDDDRGCQYPVHGASPALVLARQGAPNERPFLVQSSRVRQLPVAA